MHLHSTMYLFQHFRSRSDLQNYDIYIPLCIYFNLYQRAISAISIEIYIPLCIYFNAVALFFLSLINQFTFHYVSISTDELLQTIAFTYIFTFHYVSISTRTTMLKLYTLSNLHSTMYLFQRFTRNI